MKTRKRPALVVALFATLVGLGQPARAAVHINGFGQVIGGQTLGEAQQAGLDYDEHASFAPESLFATQLAAQLDPRVDAVAQIVARGREDYEPRFAWAYLRWIAGAHWTVRFGRQRMPVYRYSEAIEVGTSYPFLRLPRTVYDAPFNDYDGAVMTGNFLAGDWTLTPQIAVGSFEGEVRFPPRETTLQMEMSRSWGVVLEAEYRDWLSLRGSYFPSRMSIAPNDPNFAMLLQALRASGNAEAAERIETEEERSWYATASLELRHAGAFVGGEYKYFEIEDSFIGGGEGWYLSLGYRWQRWTPVLVWGRQQLGGGSDASAVTTGPLQPIVQGLEQGAREDGTQLGFSLRYDLRQNLALKLDYTRYDSRAASFSDSETVAAGVVFTY